MGIKQGGIVMPALVLLLLSGCSPPDERKEAGVLEQGTEKIAQETVNRIQTPIDRANVAKELAQDHNREVQESMEQQ